MKTITLNLIKKNRVYFKALTEKDYEVKLKITPESENLSLGEHLLAVNDISIRSKYGVDVIYEMVSEIKKDDKIVTLKADYNKDLVEECRKLGGKWDEEAKVWVFPSFVEDKVEELDYLFAGEKISIEVKAKEELNKLQDAYYLFGIKIAEAYGRDSGAKLCENVALILGKATSSGSMKNWYTTINEGSILRFSVPKNYFEKEKDKYDEVIDIKII